MSDSRYLTPGARPAGTFPSGPAAGVAGTRPAVIKLLAGVVLVAAMVLLGLLAKTGPLARLDLRVDEHIAASDRAGALTGLAKAVSILATPEIAGPALAIAVPVILLVMRRRLDAIKVFCIFAGALALTEVAKKLINEHRPPLGLQAMAADSGGSYPSGHVTAAATLAIALVVVAATLGGRVIALVLAGLFAVAVAVSRVYLGDHYPADVLGSILCALAAGLIVAGLFQLPAIQPWLGRFRLNARPGAHR